MIGNIAGTKVFEVVNQNRYVNQNVGFTYSTVQHAPLINEIRGNVARLTRNVSPNAHITIPNTSQQSTFLYNSDKDYCFDSPTGTGCNALPNTQILRFDSPSANYRDVETIIVQGRDVVINADFNNSGNENPEVPSANRMKTIIALKDSSGNGGNVYITRNVKKIYAYIVAEGSVFSGEKKTDGAADIYVENGEFHIPQRQLYINGLVVSKNTIGGVGKDSACPILTLECSLGTKKPRIYDMSCFRTYDPKKPEQNAIPQARKNLESRIKNATLVIDYNNNILLNPPIGIKKFE